MFAHLRLVRALGVTAAVIVTTRAASAQVADTARARECRSCAEWNTPQRPVHLYGNAYYVGTHGLGSVLLTSPAGHVLIDGALPESAPLIAANIRSLGFRVEDVKLILNSHVHYDHVGGIAELQRLSGARVAATASSAAVLRRGTPGADDPQYAIALAYPPVSNANNVTVFTAGHTPGGTTWSWVSCENDRCESMVYADSQTPVSADDFLFSKSAAYPTAVADFERGFGVLEHLSCDILITPHPDASGLWQRVAKRDAGDAHALEDRDACKRYAAAGRQRLAARLAKEAGKR
jgi:metallo-beta-lactamase class B